MRELLRRRMVLLAVVCLALAMPTALASADALPTGPLVPETGVYFGERLQYNAGWTATRKEAFITSRETQLGRKLDIDHHFYNWTQPFPTHLDRADKANGRIPLVSWNTVIVTDINAGKHDALIRQRADDVKAFGSPIFLRWFWEMDGAYNKSRAVSPTAFHAAWRRIHGIFQERGATNAVWVWAPTTWGFDKGYAAQWYPGDDVVDWIGASGFNWAPGQTGATWRSFKSIYQVFYNWAAQRPKPLMAAAYGAQERNAGERAAWFNAHAQALKTDFPRIRAVVYFNVAVKYDWRVLPTHNAWPAYKTFANDPYFNADPPP